MKEDEMDGACSTHGKEFGSIKGGEFLDGLVGY
jgi:hypothetical protein